MTGPLSAPFYPVEWLTPSTMMLLLCGVLLLGYFKTGVVLSVLRRGLGGIPPASVTAILALLLSGLIMAPLFVRCYEGVVKVAADTPTMERLESGLLPLREFLKQHTPP